MKYILVSGGVVSGIGKGVIASSTGLLLKTTGLKVTSIKIDPYMNIDAGTMRPQEHGEVYVLNDGGEVDLDLGNYERYLDITLSRDHNITTGKIYKEVIEKERRGDYLGKTVQVVPHVTTAIQDWIERVAKIPVDDTSDEPDICIIELGGTVGDIESAPFIEAMRQFQFRVGHSNFALIHVSLVPDMHGEQKTKPTQATVRDLRGLGLTPDLIACRVLVNEPINPATKTKISMFCHVAEEQVVGIHDVSSVYHVPLLLQQQGIIPLLQKRLELGTIEIPKPLVEKGAGLMSRWKAMTDVIGKSRHLDTVSIVLVGKYTDMPDSYMSVVKSLEHSASRCQRKLILQWVSAGHLEPAHKIKDPVQYYDAWKHVVTAQGILVPGGFGHRGTEGMILAIKRAREHKIPFLGICLGFQMAVVEWARNVCSLTDANSAEFVADTPHPVVVYMPEVSKTHLGGTMRLGLRPTVFQDGSETWSKSQQLYGGKGTIWERHRHRYEVNPEYIQRLLAAGEMEFVGRDEKGERMQVMELRDHPYFVGFQAHPEFCTRPLNPSPPFLGFVAASSGVDVLQQQMEAQLKSFVPPHPPGAMATEAELKKLGAMGRANGTEVVGNPSFARPLTLLHDISRMAQSWTRLRSLKILGRTEMNHPAVRLQCTRAHSLISRSNTPSSCRRSGGSSSGASLAKCRYASDQKPYRAAFNYQRKRDIEAQLQRGGPDFKLPSSITPLLKQNVPQDSTGFMKNEQAREIRRRSHSGSQDMQPFENLKKHISGPTYSAMTVKPFRHAFATPVQAAVLKLLPGLAEPYSDESKERKDLVAISEKGTGKSLAFLIPAIEARHKAMTTHGKLELAKQGLINNSSLEEQINRIYTRTRVGALILTTTREEATTIANEAILLSRNHHGMETRLFVGGLSKRTQLRDWMTGRRDIVVATPGRLRDLLTNEPAMREGFMYTQTLVIDQADQMLEDGFRDDIDAIVKFLPENPERQTFIFGEEQTYAVKQLASRLLVPDHHVINPHPNSQRVAHSHVPQYHTILPSADHQIPYLLKLLAHDQMTHPGKSKVLIYLPTTRIVQLFTTLVRELRTSCLPAGPQTNVYEVHSMISLLERSRSLDGFLQDNSGSSVLLTTDLTAREIKFPGTTRVIQVGIPSSDPVYFNRLAHVSRGYGKKGRCDLVLLPWEMGYLTWQLMDVPFTPLTVKELDTQLLELSETLSSTQDAGSSAPAWIKLPLSFKIMGIESEVKGLLPQLDEDSIRETFVSILGYYIPKSGEVRLQRSVIVQGAKDWTTEACGLRHPPYISDAFLIRLGINDGRTKRFGQVFDPNLRRGRPRPESHWLGRGKTVNKETHRHGPLVVDMVNRRLDSRDPSTPPEVYKTNLYGKPDPTVQGKPSRPRINPGRNLASEGWNSIP